MGKKTMNPYIVRQGDFLAKLAFIHGFDADEVWNDPKNADIKKLRLDPNILAPGDILYLPEKEEAKGLPISQGTENNYTAVVPKNTVRLAFHDDNGPLANAPYVIDGLGDPQQGSTNGDGVAEIDVPLDVRQIRITLTNQNIVFPVGIGDMDPIDEPSGVRKRLEHLDYYDPLARMAPAQISEDQATGFDQRAIAAFQTAKGLEPTGVLDDATKQALVAEHGC
jgi:hypothetical protein